MNVNKLGVHNLTHPYQKQGVSTWSFLSVGELTGSVMGSINSNAECPHLLRLSPQYPTTSSSIEKNTIRCRSRSRQRNMLLPRVAFAFLVGVLLASPFIHAGTSDFFYLLLQWPGAYCAQSACCRPSTGLPARDFFIRGLLTYNSTTGKPVTKCSKEPFDPLLLKNLTDDLTKYWSSIMCPSNNGVRFWKNNWKSYGVCSGLSETDYFKSALDLRKQVDLLSILSNKGIQESNFYLYHIWDIENAITEGIGAKPALRCSKGPFGFFQLFEIYICVDEDAKTIIECPVTPHFTCPPSVLFYPFNETDLRGSVTNAEPVQMPISIE